MSYGFEYDPLAEDMDYKKKASETEEEREEDMSLGMLLALTGDMELAEGIRDWGRRNREDREKKSKR